MKKWANLDVKCVEKQRSVPNEKRSALEDIVTQLKTRGNPIPPNKVVRQRKGGAYYRPQAKKEERHERG